MMIRKSPLSKQQILIAITTIVILIAGTLFFLYKKNRSGEVDPNFSKYIESYSTGVISKESTIRIRLASEIPVTHTLNEPLTDQLFDFTPTINGKAFWIDSRTIEFRPNKNLNPDADYEVSFKLHKLMEVPDDFKNFQFHFHTIKPDFTIAYTGMLTANNHAVDMMKLGGIIQTADAEDPVKIEKLISVNYPSKTKISWQHNQEMHAHTFTVENLIRSKDHSTPLLIHYDGKHLGILKKSEKSFDVPAIGDFKVLDIKAVQDQEQYVVVQFSDNILIGQELNGLLGIGEQIKSLQEQAAQPEEVVVGNDQNVYAIEGSTVKIYASGRMEGNYSIFVNEGIENISHKKITKKFTANVFFENRLPAVSIPGKGVILPGTGKLMMPFEAVNLKAVDVSIIKIYENNLPQYFQNNGLDGDMELRRVGKPVAQKTIRLDDDKSLNLNRKNRFMLDIDQLIKTEPGAIYRLVIGFRPAYSLYACKQMDNQTENNDHYGEQIDEDDDFWSAYDDYYPFGYNWRERDDPCSTSYYNKERWATRNILASNIGLIVKRGNDNSMLVAVTDILTAEPLFDVELEILDYQKQIILKTTSSADGLAQFTLKGKPYLLIAKQGKQRGYLKLDDGSSLPLSRFNVGGEPIQSGIKGFIYGERGVWRPGDSIYVSFILEDNTKNLAKGHPVTFDLYNPMGQLYKQITQTKSVSGFYSFHTATEPASPTGNWNAKVKVGGAVFEKKIRVETIMPNRLKLNLNFGGQTELTKNASNAGTLNARWLFGGEAHQLKAKVDAYLTAQKTIFKKFEDYTFDDPTLAFNTQVKTIFDGKLDDSGKASINADINVEKQAPGQLHANFFVKVFEPGGNFSIDQLSLPYHIYSGYTGIKTPEGDRLSGMLPTGKNHIIEIAAVDTKGNAVSGIRDVEVELYKIQWRWWWDESGNELSNFTQDQYNKLLKTETVRLTEGRGKWTLRINEPEWGRYLIRVKDPKTGHTTGKVIYIDWPNWAERLQQNNPTEAAMLSFTANKEKYQVGEEAVLTIPTPAEGRAMISLENGSKVLKTTWINTKKGQTQYQFTIEESMAPNIFVNVSLLQKHAQTINDLPIRMYGTIPILVENPKTILKPIIQIANQLRPETRSTITVSEQAGREMTYTIAIVDEGLLDITGFKTPDPHAAFYAREALGVKTWDLFDFVIGAFGGGLERILSIGGDQSGRTNGKQVTANRFIPVVKFMGPFHLEKGEKQTRQFTLPSYIGSVKAMVVAGYHGSYGFSEKAVAVKKPLMLLATLPRVLSPSEKIALPVTIFAMENNIRQVNVEIQSNAFSNLKDNNRKTVTFSKPGDQLITFDLNIKDFVGIGKVKIIATSGNEKAVYDVELNVRNPNPVITKILEKELLPGESWRTAYEPVGMNGTNKATLEVSSIPSVNLAKRLEYLIQYPHGCVEQITSAVFPQLYLGQLTDINERKKAEIDRNIKSGINRLKGFQIAGGALSYWPDGGQGDEWGTSYAGHFMLEAQAAGYELPVGFINEWKKFQRGKALNWAPDAQSFYGADLQQAYRLYVLALAKAPELGAMNRLKEFPYLGVAAKWRLAAAYKLAGQPEAGQQLIRGLSTKVQTYNNGFGTYGSDLRDEAMILETFTLLGKQKEAAAMVRTVAARLSADQWFSTQTTAYSLIAIAKYCGQSTSGNKLDFNYQAAARKETVSVKSYVWQGAVNASGGALNVKNDGQNRLFIRVIQQGQPGTGQDFKPENNPDVLQMTVAYFSLAGKPIDPASLAQGTDFVAQVNFKNPGKLGSYNNLALSQIFPSGWEILNTRLMNNDEAFKSSPSDYRDFRDDRVNTYFSLSEGKQATYFVMLNAAYAGRYYLPPVYCEAMYDATINAAEKGRWVEIYNTAD
ncbi:MAG: alpha-2-macroglobulin family protein [Sphingobacteriaceae bacterium]